MRAQSVLGRWVFVGCCAAMAGCVERPMLAPTDAHASDVDAGETAGANADADANVTVADADASATAGDACARAVASADDVEAYERLVQCVGDAAVSDAVARETIAGVVRAVEGRGGFPIVGGGQVRFVYVRDARYDGEDDARSTAEDFALDRRAEPLSVAGDFNAWSDSALPLRHVGRGLFVGALAMTPSPAARWGYKLVARDARGAPVVFSDPLSRRFQYDDNGRISFVRGATTAGHLEWVRSAPATRLMNDRPLYVYVPPGYDQRASERYPVLYLHDGNNAFDTAQPRSAPSSWDVDAASDAEILAGRARPFVLVAVPNNNARMDEYTHTRDVIDGTPMGGRGDDYVDYLVRDVKSLIDARYRTLASREHTAVLGSSLGGLISFHAGLSRPEVFGLVGGMSSTFEWGGFGGGSDTMLARYARAGSLAARAQRFYLDSGGGPAADGTCTFDGVEDPRDNFCETNVMRDTLVAAGVRTFPLDPNALRIEPAGADIYHWYERDAPHNEAAWRRRFYRALRFFFRP